MSSAADAVLDDVLGHSVSFLPHLLPPASQVAITCQVEFLERLDVLDKRVEECHVSPH